LGVYFQREEISWRGSEGKRRRSRKYERLFDRENNRGFIN